MQNFGTQFIKILHQFLVHRIAAFTLLQVNSFSFSTLYDVLPDLANFVRTRNTFRFTCTYRFIRCQIKSHYILCILDCVVGTFFKESHSSVSCVTCQLLFYCSDIFAYHVLPQRRGEVV